MPDSEAKKYLLGKVKMDLLHKAIDPAIEELSEQSKEVVQYLSVPFIMEISINLGNYFGEVYAKKILEIFEKHQSEKNKNSEKDCDCSNS